MTDTKREGCCGHASDCAVHNEPAMPRGLCDCGHREALRVEYDRKVMRQRRWVRVYNWFVCHTDHIAAVLMVAFLVGAALVIRHGGG